MNGLQLLRMVCSHFAKTFGIKHIPHVTVATNLVDEETAKKICLKFPQDAKFQLEQPVEFPSLYKIDPLCAAGFYVRLYVEGVQDIELGFPPHMSVAQNLQC